MVIVKTNKKGIGKFNDIFWPVTNSCKFDQQELEESKLTLTEPGTDLDLQRQFSLVPSTKAGDQAVGVGAPRGERPWRFS